MTSSDDFPGRVGPAIALSVAPPEEYIKAIGAHLGQGRQELAYGLLLQASEHYPEDPVLLWYRGWLGAVIDKKYQSSIETCRKALVVFKTANTRSMGTVYPILYLNLGRALFAEGRRQEAIENFKHGLKHDPNNSELKKELQRIGIRQQPLVSFLSRSNPINKYIGKMIRTSHRSPQRTVHNHGADSRSV